MRAAAGLLVSIALGFLIRTDVASAVPGTAGIRWDDCSNVATQKSFTGPGQQADLVFTVVGTSSPHKGFRFKLSIGTGLSVPDAWQFGTDGCNAGALTVNDSLDVACPRFRGTRPLTLWNYGFQNYYYRYTEIFDVLSAYDEVSNPNPATTYRAATIRFDHSASVAGAAGSPAACGGAEEGVCIWLIYTEFLHTDLSSAPFSINSYYLTWNSISGCPQVQTRSTTWGRVKGLYR